VRLDTITPYISATMGLVQYDSSDEDEDVQIEEAQACLAHWELPDSYLTIH